MQLHYGEETASIDTCQRIKARHELQPTVLKVKLPRRIKPAIYGWRKQCATARAMKGAA